VEFGVRVGVGQPNAEEQPEKQPKVPQKSQKTAFQVLPRGKEASTVRFFDLLTSSAISVSLLSPFCAQKPNFPSK
jgi:hypothetical protein